MPIKQTDSQRAARLQDDLDRARQKCDLLTRDLAAVKKENISAEEIRQEIYGLSALIPSPPAWVSKITPGHSSGVPMTIWSDWHHGERVRAEETGGMNEFDREIAKQRVQRLVDSTIDLCFSHMTNPKYPGVIVCLGGDMISGEIHEEFKETNEGSIQECCLEVEELLIAGLTQMADKFGKVFVPAVVGNHGRGTLKVRAKRRVAMSYEWNIYQHLERHFRNDSRLKFVIPYETDVMFTVNGHRFLLTHGDSLGVRGGDGIIGAIGPIARGALKTWRSEAQIGRDFDTLIMGHWHSYLPSSDMLSVIVNGALKGYDEFARLMLRARCSRPSQALWFVHKKYGITAQWPIYVEPKADVQPNVPWVTWQEDTTRG